MVKKTVIVNNIDKKQAEYTERLRHYNEWLMDDTRDVTSTYPGFPGDAKKEKTTIVVEKPEVAPIKSTKGSKNSMKIQLLLMLLLFLILSLLLCQQRCPLLSFFLLLSNKPKK